MEVRCGTGCAPDSFTLRESRSTMMHRCWALLCCALCAVHAAKLCHASAAARRFCLLGHAHSRACCGHDGPNEWSRLPTRAHEPLPTACAHAAALSAHHWLPGSQCRDMVPQRRHLLARPGELWPKGKPHPDGPCRKTLDTLLSAMPVSEHLPPPKWSHCTCIQASLKL